MPNLTNDTLREVSIFTLTSPLHDQQTVARSTDVYLQSLGIQYTLYGEDYSTYGSHTLDLIYVRTGGTEGLLRKLLPTLREQSTQPIILLTSGESNSLAASMEILSFLRQHSIKGEILHGTPQYIARRIDIMLRIGEAFRILRRSRLGVVGQPSDWLIASTVDRVAVRQRFGIDIVDIDIEDVVRGMQTSDTPVPEEWKNLAVSDRVRDALAGAMRIYDSLKSICQNNQLAAFTIRCFDLLGAVHNTSCMALARLNSEGIIAGCEGDIPSCLTMHVAQALTGQPGFQANPAFIDTEKGEILLAHCTIPLNMVSRYTLDTHFESGIGAAVRGYMPAGPVTLFKMAGDARKYFVAEGELIQCEDKPNLCRTQARIQLNDPSQAKYFLTNPIGNHHILLAGHHKALIDTFMN